MSAPVISIMSVPVSDQDRAKAFYTDVLNFKVVIDNVFGEGMRWVMLRPQGGGAAITLVTWFASMPPGSLQGTILSVPDIEAALAQLKSTHVAPLEDAIQEAPWGRWVTVKDPDGNRWVIQEDSAFTASLQ